MISPWWYVVLWLFYLWLFIAIISYGKDGTNNIVVGGMYFIEFGIHEAAHILFGFMPPLFVAAAGSLSEVTFTVLLAYAGFRSRSYFAGIFGLIWVMLSTASAGMYMADARAQQMQLVGLGADPLHDWHFVFGQLGWLDADMVIGNVVKTGGVFVAIIGLVIGAIRIVKLFTDHSAIAIVR